MSDRRVAWCAGAAALAATALMVGAGAGDAKSAEETAVVVRVPYRVPHQPVPGTRGPRGPRAPGNGAAPVSAIPIPPNTLSPDLARPKFTTGTGTRARVRALDAWYRRQLRDDIDMQADRADLEMALRNADSEERRRSREGFERTHDELRRKACLLFGAALADALSDGRIDEDDLEVVNRIVMDEVAAITRRGQPRGPHVAAAHRTYQLLRETLAVIEDPQGETLQQLSDKLTAATCRRLVGASRATEYTFPPGPRVLVVAPFTTTASSQERMLGMRCARVREASIEDGPYRCLVRLPRVRDAAARPERAPASGQ